MCGLVSMGACGFALTLSTSTPSGTLALLAGHVRAVYRCKDTTVEQLHVFLTPLPSRCFAVWSLVKLIPASRTRAPTRSPLSMD
jgi:hypothetical protein